MSNVITAVLTEGCVTTSATAPAYQYDYGQILQITGIDLPTAYQVHFSNNRNSGDSITMIGNADGVAIPDELLATGSDVYAFLFLQTGATDGETEYRITIPVHPRPAITDYEPTPTQQGAIDQLISALNDAVETADGFASDAELSAQDAANSATAAQQSEANASQSAISAAASATAAETSANEAETSATRAGDFSTSASLSAVHARDSAASALQSAERAEQAASTAGYMFFYIDSNGDLIYQRTSNTQVDFYLSDGDLIVRANA